MIGRLLTGAEWGAAPRVVRPAVMVATVCALVLAVIAATASAATLTWSAPRSIDTSLGQSLVEVQCPSSAICVTLDASGRTASFGPATRKSSVPVQVAGAPPPTALACPSATQCTAITTTNQAYTFDPAAPKASSPLLLESPAPTSVDQPGPAIFGLACASTSLCVAADTNGNAITFDPSSTAVPVVTALSAVAWSSVACPSTTQCTIAGGGDEATFDPTAPAAAGEVAIEQGKRQIVGLACPSDVQCTALDQDGGEVTFDPETPPATAPNPFGVGSTSAEAIACGSTTQCTVTSPDGKESTFDPTTPTAALQSAKIDKSNTGGGPGQTEGVTAISCPAATSCVAVDASGQAIAFAPSSPGSPSPVRIDGGSPLLGVSCPGTRQCSAIGPYLESTFAPLGGHRVTHGAVVTDHFFQASDVVCTTATRCLAIVEGRQGAFDPKRFKLPKEHQLASYSDAGIVGIACPAAGECVATDTDGYGVSYDPLTAKFIKRRIKVEAGEALTGVACSSTTQCTAIDNDGVEITFQPRTGRQITATRIDASVGLDAPSGDSDNELDDISCPRVTICVAVDSRGDAVAFNPRSKHSVKPTATDAGQTLTSISCPTVNRCVAVDANGRALAGTAKPSTWVATQVPGASALTAIDCPSANECVAVDVTGDEFTGRG
ncbi:MAG: hypothetical protein WAL22_11530 [Solirubrobacteraceae bacterium]